MVAPAGAGKHDAIQATGKERSARVGSLPGDDDDVHGVTRLRGARGESPHPGDVRRPWRQLLRHGQRGVQRGPQRADPGGVRCSGSPSLRSDDEVHQHPLQRSGPEHSGPPQRRGQSQEEHGAFGRGQPETPRHRLHRPAVDSLLGVQHRHRGRDAQRQRPRATGQDPALRPLQHARLGGGSGPDGGRTAGLGAGLGVAVPVQPDLEGSGVRDHSLRSSPRHQRERLLAARGRIPDRQVHAGRRRGGPTVRQRALQAGGLPVRREGLRDRPQGGRGRRQARNQLCRGRVGVGAGSRRDPDGWSSQGHSDRGQPAVSVTRPPCG